MTKHQKTGNKKNHPNSSINVFNVKSKQRMKREKREERGERNFGTLNHRDRNEECSHPRLDTAEKGVSHPQSGKE